MLGTSVAVRHILCPVCMHTEETPTYNLQDCILSTNQWTQTWPEGADLQTKLWVSAAGLECTTRFIDTDSKSEWLLSNAEVKKLQ